MTEYYDRGVNLTKGQAKKIAIAHKKGSGATIRLSKANLNGNINLPLTQTQINKIKKAKTGVQLNLSESQLKHMEKTGGFIPLLTLIPIIPSALGAAGGVAGGVASAVSSAKANAEQARHNRAIEEQLKSGSGVVSNIVGKIPVIGNFLELSYKRLVLAQTLKIYKNLTVVNVFVVMDYKSRKLEQGCILNLSMVKVFF